MLLQEQRTQIAAKKGQLFNLSIIVVVILIVISFGVEHGVDCLAYNRKKIVIQGDLMIGALLPVHEQPSYKETEQANSRRVCGVIRDQYGVQRVEALMYMLDQINNKNITKLLPGVNLGLEIRDECWDSSIALEETIDFIKDTIAIDNNETEDDSEEIIIYGNTSSALSSSSSSSSSVIVQPSQLQSSGELSSSVINFLPNNSPSLIEKCAIVNREKKNMNKILAVIGPGGSSVAINVQNLLQLFDIPQIGYSATSRDLSDKKMFKTFVRVVPSDYLQVRAIVDLVVKMNWTYLFAIYTDGSYGQAGMEAFRNETSYLNICLALYEKIREYASESDYEVVIRKMNTTASARVIVCFCYGETIRGLLRVMNKLNLKGRFLIVGSDGWSDRIDVAKDFYEEAVGSFSFKAYSPKVTQFDDYFVNLNPSNNQRNVWFNEYWEEIFKCYIDESSMSKFKIPCKRKCPINFVEIGGKCYWISTQNLNWIDAQKECKLKYFNSNLLDLNNSDDVLNVLEYLALNGMTEHLLRMHMRIKIPMESTEDYSSELDEKKSFNFVVSNGESGAHGQSLSLEQGQTRPGEEPQTLKLVHCKKFSNYSELRKRVDYELDEYGYLIKNDSFSNFEDSLSDEDVITFFNSKINRHLQCVSILIMNRLTGNQKNNFSYCIQFNNCFKKLPFVCKFHPDENKIANKSKLDFYPDTLRNYQQDPKMSYVINSFLTVVHGLDRIHKKFCHGISGLCEKMKKLNGSELLKNIKESVFFGITNEKIYFDRNGDPPGRYVILNVQKEHDHEENKTRYVYKEVGDWNNDNRLNLNFNLIKFPNEYKNYRSVCSEACGFGQVKQIQGGIKCCWTCKKCEDYAYVANEYTCKDCDYGFWPNRNLTGCQKLPLTFLKWNDLGSLVALFVSSLGVIVNTFITYVFLKFSNTCVVKSTTKELSYIILTGIYLCYLMTVPLILRPTKFTCYLYRILPGLSLSLIYGALITKTNRIARILARSKKRILTKKPRFMSLTAQIIITIIIIAIECALIIGAFIVEPGDLLIDDRSKRNEARLMCFNKTWSVLGPIGYNMFLVVLCTLYAVRTRNLPENFNEAKFIGFSMYTTCVIWLAFIPLYFGSDFKVITLCLSTSFSASVILIFLFFPKVYIIIFEPEKNQRSAFATSKEIRCHFGSTFQSNSVEIEKSRMSNGLSLLGLRTDMKSSLRTSSLKSKSANTRFAYRPKSTYGTNDKSMDSFETYASMYQISDRSCQTSLELLEPFVDRAIKRKKMTKNELGSTTSDDQEHSVAGNENEAGINPLGVDPTEKPANTLGALGNLLLIPLIATHNQLSPPNMHGKSVNLTSRNDIELDKLKNRGAEEVEKLSLDENNNPIGGTTYIKHKRFSHGNILKESFKVFNKAKLIRASMKASKSNSESIEKSAQNGGDSSPNTSNLSDDNSPPANKDNHKDKTGHVKLKPSLKFMKNKNVNVLNQIAENSTGESDEPSRMFPINNNNNNDLKTSTTRNSSNTLLNLNYSSHTSSDNESIYHSKNNNTANISVSNISELQQHPAQEDGIATTTDSNLSLSNSANRTQQTTPNNFLNYSKTNNLTINSATTNTNGATSDCESEFTIKMELEDKSLEDFKRVITQNKNIILNWDYVQSSDYL